MLSQQIGFYSEQIARGGKNMKAELQETIILHDLSFYALKNGGVAPGIANDKLLPPAREEILNFVLSAEELWEQYKGQAEVIVKEPTFIKGRLNPQVFTAINFIEKNSQDMLERNNEIVMDYVMHNGEKQRSFTVLLLFIASIWGLFIGFSFYFIKRFIMRPLKNLQMGTEKIRDGNLNHILAIESSDEIGQLSLTFNEMTRRLKESRQNIEEKIIEKTKDLEKYKLAVDNVADNIVISDSEGIVLYANKAIERTIGYKPEEAVGKKSAALWKSPMPIEFYRKLWDTIKKQKKIFTGEIVNKRKNGDLYTAIISISPILNKKGDVEFFVAIERDITKEKEIDKAKTEFVSVASHALRTPLTAIRGIVSMLLDEEYGKIDKEIKSPLKDIETSSERLTSLVNDLLNISRIQAGRMKYKLTDFPVDKLIKDVVHFLKPISDQKEITLTTGKLDKINVQCDSEKVQEVLNNLIGNSFKFTDKGEITISTKNSGETVEVYVSDTGIGIKKEDQNKLFGLFQQIESGAGRPIGTGFGLHVSRELVHKMGGELWLERSEIGKGSVFAFTIPKSKTKLAKKTKHMIEREMKMHPDQKTAIIKKISRFS